MRISYVPKDELRTSAPIASVAAALGIRIDREGRGLCPFHDDHDPSLRVWVDDHGVPRWACYPCGLGGAVFDLVQLVEGVGFGRAYRKVLEISREVVSAPSPPRKADLDEAALVAYVSGAMVRGREDGCDGWICVA